VPNHDTQNTDLLFYYDSIGCRESCGRGKCVYPILFAIFTSEGNTVTTTEPWFDADKRSILARWGPKTDYRRIKTHGEVRRFIEGTKGDFRHLRVLENIGISVVE
jgi:hypothetical protein